MQGAGRVVQQHGRNVVRGAWCMAHGAWRRVHGAELDAGAGAVGAGAMRGHLVRGGEKKRREGDPSASCPYVSGLH